ncbi:MAG: BREX-1 system adenine-specific DNA-methyltransferase PglX [Selenomonadaceae bacterium]|nr:BREX-1 system adenine-specific DNA-methyltransferase PglX [Selenomonadaceae bacterium]
MDKNAIKKYAIWARRELIERVTQRAWRYEVKDNTPQAGLTAIEGRVLEPVEQRQRERLVREVQAHGFQAVMEEAAYTWFNRFAALRFMEVNGYLPSHVRIFSDEQGAFQPEILHACLTMDEPWLDQARIFAMQENNETAALYKYLLIAQCNALGEVLPAMFEPLADWTELLLPDNLLRGESVLAHLVADIPEEDWRDAVQIIGWLYQYYNTEPKNAVFAAKDKVKKEDIPAATQLFTPDWIVRYMVENSLGRYWLERHPECSAEAFGWRYYLPEAEQEPAVAQQLAAIREASQGVRPEDIRLIDPCMGSGHILVYAFTVLAQIYTQAGYPRRQIAKLILEHNLYGLDIDERAYQLAYFAVMMQARQIDSRIFTRGVQPHLAAIVETNGIEPFELAEEPGFDTIVVEEVNDLLAQFRDAKEYGSLLTPEAPSPDLLARWEKFKNEADLNLLLASWIASVDEILPQLVQQAEMLAKKYEIVATNPPYLSGGMETKLVRYLKAEYPNGKNDMYAAFIERCGNFINQSGYQSMITQHTWMFLSTYEKLRADLAEKTTVTNMVHLGARAFEEISGEVVQTVAFVIYKGNIRNYKAVFERLVAYNTSAKKEAAFFSHEDEYFTYQENFKLLPGLVYAYWLPASSMKLFSNNSVEQYFTVKVGLMTTDNGKYLRYFWEPSFDRIFFDAHSSQEAQRSLKRWFPHNKGGSYRKWYGNQDYVVDWENNGEHIKQSAIRKYPYLKGNPNFVVHDDGYYFQPHVSWSEIALGNLAFRYFESGFTFNVKGMSAFQNSTISLFYLLGLANSKPVSFLANAINPSISFGAKSFNKLPLLIDDRRTLVEECAKHNVEIAKADWDSFETSWDFLRHPLLTYDTPRLADAYRAWQATCEERFCQLRANEEELNRIFIDIYGLQDELTPDVAERDVTVARIYDTKEDIPETMKGNAYVLTRADVVRSLLSYAVGCMFGRYSLDTPGLVYAGGTFDTGKYPSFAPDDDAIIPICDEDYFPDDITGRFVAWLRAAYGDTCLQENLDFIATALGGKGSALDTIRSYFLSDFYRDHCQRYQKRPIYWLCDAGRRNSFKALIYIHRYDRDTMARLRTGYVYNQQEIYKNQIDMLEQREANAASNADRTRTRKQLKKMRDQLDEIHAYEERVHHYADLRQPLDLDDGVKHNYTLFEDILAKIK